MTCCGPSAGDRPCGTTVRSLRGRPALSIRGPRHPRAAGARTMGALGPTSGVRSPNMFSRCTARNLRASPKRVRATVSQN
jgi:hypothetical protein